MSGNVDQAFHAAVLGGLPGDFHHLLDPAIGTGPVERDLRRAYRLTQRAAEWAGDTIAHCEPTSPNRFESPCPEIQSPEFGRFLALIALMQRRHHQGDAALKGLCSKVVAIGESLARCNEQALDASARDLLAVAEFAGGVLIDSAGLRGGAWEWACDEANGAKRGLA